MNPVTNTNIRVGLGVYNALKELSDKSGLTIGTWADLMVISSLLTLDKTLSTFTPDTQKALTADGLAFLSEIFKLASLEAVKDTSLAEMYKNLLSRRPRY